MSWGRQRTAPSRYAAPRAAAQRSAPSASSGELLARLTSAAPCQGAAGASAVSRASVVEVQATIRRDECTASPMDRAGVMRSPDRASARPGVRFQTATA